MSRKLTDIYIRNFKPSEKIEKLGDGESLFLWVFPHGSKLWRYHYRLNGKQRTLSIGSYPEISLKDARETLAEARSMVAKGIDPNEEKQEEATISFKKVANEWIDNQSNIWSEGHTKTVVRRLEKNIYPYIGNADIKDINPQDVLKCIRIIEERGSYEVASRTLGICSMVFRYGVAIDVCESDPCRDLKGALVPRRKGQLAAITEPEEAGALMANINEYHGSKTVKLAMIFSALTFCRPGEIRKAEWQEFNFNRNLWTIPARKMKGRKEHVVPLSKQALAVLERMKPLSGNSKYVFPNPRSKQRPLSDGAVNAAIRRMGYTKNEMTAHGFRSMASSLLNEKGERFDVIETQLAHSGADKVRAIYNRAEYMNERKKLMQKWADYLDELENEFK